MSKTAKASKQANHEFRIVRRPLTPTKVLLDTSFIVTMSRQHRDPWAEVRDLIKGKTTIVTLDLVVYELERLARQGPPTAATWAKASLELIGKRNYHVVDHKPGPSEVDGALIAHALAESEVTAVATVDRELRKILAANGVPAIWPRTRHGLLSSGF